MKYFFGLLACLFVLMSSQTPAQGQVMRSSAKKQNPKLVVGIVVDQMRYEFIPRFWNKFENGGFKRLIGQGYSFTNMHYNYFPTYTGPGHAAIYTGATPAVNGIVGNSWYARDLERSMYVVEDTSVTAVGRSEAAPRSPRNLLSSTFTDELKQAHSKSKVVTVSIKDRGAVLPGGHLADGAYWYDDPTGQFISSSWYMKKLPDWVQTFNTNGRAKELSNQTWSPLLPKEQYTESRADRSRYEEPFGDEADATFPHAMNGSLGRIQSSPFGNTLTAEFALAAQQAEHLGADNTTDFLGISFSSTDYVGHQFGPNSMEVEDTYLRLDRTLAHLLQSLDARVGKGNYTVFLTSDHGVVDNPAMLADRGMPGGLFNARAAIDSVQAMLNSTYGEHAWIEGASNMQLFLNHDVITEQGESLTEMQQAIADYLLRFNGVASTATAHNYKTQGYSSGLQAMYQRGYYARRSGDVYIQLAPGWLARQSITGSSHGSPYSYDTHVPLIFYGKGVPQGTSAKPAVITQIAPTVSSMLQIEFPNGSSHEVLSFE